MKVGRCILCYMLTPQIDCKGQEKTIKDVSMQFPRYDARRYTMRTAQRCVCQVHGMLRNND